MSSSESASGVAASLKADKANRESLAKRKSAVKADLERVTAELADVEQMKAEAEDLEDEDLLAEMLAEEQRLQELRLQYTTELASIQEQSQAAAQALRQRLRRLTGDRALSVSGKSTSSESSQLASVPSADLTSAAAAALEPSAPGTVPHAGITASAAKVDSSAPATATVPYAGTTAQAASAAFPSAGSTAQAAQGAPGGASYGSALTSAASPSSVVRAASTAGHSNSGLYSGTTHVAQPTIQPTLSNLPLSASWGVSEPVQMSMPSQASQQSYMQPEDSAQSQRSYEQPQNADVNSSNAPQSDYHSQSYAPGGSSITSTVSQFGVSQPQGSITDTRHAGFGTSDQDSAFSNARSLIPEGYSPTSGQTQQSGQSAFRAVTDSNKPPRPASNFSGQQGIAKTGTAGGPALGDRLSSKASMVSQGSGYVADSDSNSDVQVEPQRPPLNSEFSLSTPDTAVADKSAAGESFSAAKAPVAAASIADKGAAGESSAAAKEAEQEAGTGTPPSLLEKVGQSVWGAVEAITGQPHSHQGTAGGADTTSKEAGTAGELPTESSSSKTDKLHGDTGASEVAELTQSDSGYEAGEEGPVQAGPEGTTPHSFTSEQPSSATLNTHPHYPSSGIAYSQPRVTQPQPQHADFSNSASEPAAQHDYSRAAEKQSPGPLHVSTDGGSSKRGISGVYDDQPGSASKRPKGDSAFARLINTFDSPRSEPLSPSGQSRGLESPSKRFFTEGTSRDPQGGFTQGSGPSQGRAAAGSPFSSSFRPAPAESLGSGALAEDTTPPPSIQASQGSVESNRDLNLGSVGSIGNQSELNHELNSASQTQGLSAALPVSAANLAQTGVSTAGVTGHSTADLNEASTAGVTGHSTAGLNELSTAGVTGHGTAGLTGRSTAGLTEPSTAGVTGSIITDAVTLGVPVVAAPMSSLPPSASWGRPPSPPQVGEVTRQETGSFGAFDSTPEQDFVSQTVPYISSRQDTGSHGAFDSTPEQGFEFQTAPYSGSSALQGPALIEPEGFGNGAFSSTGSANEHNITGRGASATEQAGADSKLHKRGAASAAAVPEYDLGAPSGHTTPTPATADRLSDYDNAPDSYTAQTTALDSHTTQADAPAQSTSGFGSSSYGAKDTPSEGTLPLGSTVSSQEQPQLGGGTDVYDRSVQPVHSAAAAGATSQGNGQRQEPVQSRQAQFDDVDDAFAQFSPFGHKARQQANPFGQQTRAKGLQSEFEGQQGISERQQGAFEGQQGVSERQELPFGTGTEGATHAKEAAGQNAAQTDKAIASAETPSVVPARTEEQVTPTSVTGTFAEQTPFESSRPPHVSTPRLDSQQSFGAGSYNDMSPRSGLGSPRRRPPPTPVSQDPAPVTRTISSLSASSLQGPQEPLQPLPTDTSPTRQPHSTSAFQPPLSLPTGPSAKGQPPSPPAFQSPLSQPESVSQQAASTAADLPNGAGHLSSANIAPESQATRTGAADTQAPASSRGVSGVASQAGQKDVNSAAAPLATARGQSDSAFSKATAGPSFSTDLGQASPVGKPHLPLSSWTSFEDPGPLPPMPPPNPDDDPADDDFWAQPKAASAKPATAEIAKPAAGSTATTSSAATAEAALATQLEKQQTNDPWAVEPPAEVKQAEQELLTANLAGLGIGGDAAWGNSFGPDMGKPMSSEPEALQTAQTPAVTASQAPTTQEAAPIKSQAKSQAETSASQPSWMSLASSSNPFAQFSFGGPTTEPNPWATSAQPETAPPTASLQPPSMGQPMSAVAASAAPTSQASAQQYPSQQQQAPQQQQQQQQSQQAGLGGWDAFSQPTGAVAYPAVDNSRHPDVVNKSAQLPAGAKQLPEQQQYPSPPNGPGDQQGAQGKDPFGGSDWAAFGGSGQTRPPGHQQPAGGDLWSAFAAQPPNQQAPQQQQPQQSQQQPRAAIIDSWASFDAPSEQSGLGAPVASQQTSHGISNMNSQDSWSAFDPNNNAGARSRAGAGAGLPPSSSSSQRPQGVGSAGGYVGGYDMAQPTSPDRKGSIEEIPVQELGIDPSLTITATPKAGTQRPPSQFDYPQQGGAQSQGYDQPLQKPKRGSSSQFGSVFSPGSANSVSKLTNMFKKDKKGQAASPESQYNGQGGPEALPPSSAQGGSYGAPPGAAPGQGAGASLGLPPTPRGRRAPPPPAPQPVSEVDSWRPQTTEERQQCMDAYDAKGYGRLGGLSEVDARALWTRQNMPPDSFVQVFALSDMDSNKLLSKPEFCLFMYLMHALRNFGGSFRLPNQITPNQAARILGLEQLIRPNTSAPPAVSSSQGYNPATPATSNGSLQGPQQYPQQYPQQQFEGGQGPQQYPQQQFGGGQDWQTTGGLSPSQQQAVQELTALGFDARQSQEALEAHTWNKNAAANWLLQGGSAQPQGPALRRSTTDRTSYAPSVGSGGSGGFGSQSLRGSGGSGVGRLSHTRSGSAASTAEWGSGNWSPTSQSGYSQPGSARTTGDSVASPRFGTPNGTPRSGAGRVPVQGNAHLSLTIRKAKMDYKGIMEKPFFTLSVRTRGGSLLEQSQDTPPGVFSNGVMMSDQTLVLTTPISEFPQGSVLFFELKHWKPKEKKFSLRGWALVAVSSLVDYSGSVPQLQTGTMKLSLLQKPVDLALSRKHKRLSPEGFDLEVNVNLASF